MATARKSHTATVLSSGEVLVAGGLDPAGVPLASAELYDGGAGSWSGTTPMAMAHYQHTMTLLPSGMVLVAGGTTLDAGILAPVGNAELFNRATGSWSETGSLALARTAHTATLLGSGKVLVAGGFDPSGNSLTSAELYDPMTGSFTTTGSMNRDRGFHTATLLESGQVLVAGGYGLTDGRLYGNDTELYDPALKTWTIVHSLAQTTNYTATVLQSGWVLFTGGYAQTGASLFEPGTQAVSATAPPIVNRQQHTATLLPSGQLLLAGGFDGDFVVQTSAEVYDSNALYISPPAAVAYSGQSVMFTATGGSLAGYVWSFLRNSSGGTFDSNENYTAGPVGGGTDIVGVRDSAGNELSASVVVQASIRITPSNVTVAPKTTVAFIASGGSGGYQWTFDLNASGGTLVSNPDGMATYTSGPMNGTVDNLSVKDSLGNFGFAYATVTAQLVVSPASPTVASGAKQAFTASGGTSPYSFALTTNSSGGSVTRTGDYTAGPISGVDDVIQATDSAGITGAAAVHVIPGSGSGGGGCNATGGGPLSLLALLGLFRFRRRRVTGATGASGGFSVLPSSK